MLTVGFILLICPVYLAKTIADFQSDNLVFVNEGESVNITCSYQSDLAMHFSWYKHKLGQKPKLVSSFYKYDKKATFYYEFKTARFSMVNENGITHLEIRELQVFDTAAYYCGSAYSNIVEFRDGTNLIVQASQMHSVLQQHVIGAAGSVTLNCTIFTDRCAEEQDVYWFRHSTGKSRPGIMYTNGDNSGFCQKQPTASSSRRSCVYSLPKTNLTTADAGTYYCAVAVCGEILFGSGTKLDITGLGCSGHIHTLVLFSIIRSSVLLCCVIVIMMCVCLAKNNL